MTFVSPIPVIHPILKKMASGTPLTETMAFEAFQCLMTGQADQAQMGAFLMGLCCRGETVDEITAGAKALRQQATLLEAPPGAVDTCGTGGDGLKTYNISTAAALVVAACGVPVPKHGNRSVSSKSGSSDVLQALGARLEIPLKAHLESLQQFNFTFLFAPRHHSAVRHVAPARASLGIRTIFNLLGPLANPAGAKRQLLGVYDTKWLRPMAEVLHRLGSKKVWVVRGRDGLDEISISGITDCVALENNKITSFTLTPESVGLKTYPVKDLEGGTAEINAQAMLDIFAGKACAYLDSTLFNAAASLLVADRVKTLQEGVEMARSAVQSGAVEVLLKHWIAFTVKNAENI